MDPNVILVNEHGQARCELGERVKDLSLRDYFAGQALHAPWGEAVTPEAYSDGVVTPDGIAALATNCYALADAMLKARTE